MPASGGGRLVRKLRAQLQPDPGTDGVHRDHPRWQINEVASTDPAQLTPEFVRIYTQVGRALYGEVIWDADQKGLPSPSTNEDSGYPSADFRGRVPPRRDARQHYRPRGAPAAQGAETRSSAGVSGPCPDGNRNGLLMDFTVSLATARMSRKRFLSSWTGSELGATSPARWTPTMATTPRAVCGTFRRGR